MGLAEGLKKAQEKPAPRRRACSAKREVAAKRVDPGEVLPVRKVTTEELIVGLRDRAKRLLESVDSVDLREAGLKDRMIALGIIFDKLHQVSGGVTTHRIEVDDRRDVKEAVQALLAEVERRKIELDRPVAIEAEVVK